MNSNFTLKVCAGLFAGLISVSSYGQTTPKKFGSSKIETVKCATTEYEEYLQQKLPGRASTQQFEEWLAPKVQAEKAKRFLKNNQDTNEVVTIPVVFHVIHNGDAIGTDENISEEQILSQITVLNQDYRKMAETPGYNENPVGADMEIQFCLAQRDPDGNASSGITRHYYENNDLFGWEMTQVEEIIKPQTQWDPSKYLNIWVVSNIYIEYMGAPAGELAGYAQFPTESGLDGLNEPGMPQLASTDGVALGAMYCGSSEIYPEGSYDQVTGRDRGRTATHEIGHFLGLRHIWGDGGCNVDDFCEDTPVTANANQGCPDGMDSCPSSPGLDMIENYMDYTFDTCQNVFTQDQKDRMQAVLANSPRRASLLTSDGCQPGATYDLDGALNMLNLNKSCDGTIAPTLAIENVGTETITSATISFQIDEDEAQTFEWTGSIIAGEATQVTFDEIQPALGEHTFNATITAVNDTEEGTTLNNNIEVPFSVIGIPTAVTDEVIVTINTDNGGDEVLWALIEGNDFNADPIATGGEGAYGDNQTYTTSVSVESGKCYTFVIIDIMGNGLCCQNGNGSYSITDSEGNILAQGAQFSIIESKGFGIDITFDNEDFNNPLQKAVLYPNPTSGIINIAMPDNNLPENYTIYNSLGQVVASAKVNSADNLKINTSAYSNGIYFIRLEKDDQSTTLKFVKN